MAIFASTTTSGYSDPMKALSIKALEARQKEMARVKPGEITPDNTQTPVQGIGHVLNQLGDSMAQGRVMQAAATQREMLAQTIAHMDPNNPKPEELARISTADPEMMREMLHTMAENRRNAANNATTQRGQDLTRDAQHEGHEVTREGQHMTADTAAAGQEVTRRGQDISHTDTQASQEIQRHGQDVSHQDTQASQEIQRAGQQLQLDLADKNALYRREENMAERTFKTAQSELDRALARGTAAEKTAAQAKLAEAQHNWDMVRDKANNEAKANMPQSPLGGIAHDEKGGILPEGTAAAATAKANAADPKTVEALAAKDHELTQRNNLVDELTSAQVAFDKGIYMGRTSDAQTFGAQLPLVGGLFGDKEKADRTSLFDSVMDRVATGAMSTILKGASTDKEMVKFIEQYNNKNIGIEAKRAQFVRVLEAAKHDRDIDEKAVKSLGGTPTRPTAPTEAAPAKLSPEDTEASLANARKAIAAGKDPEFIKSQLQKHGIDPKGL